MTFKVCLLKTILKPLICS